MDRPSPAGDPYRFRRLPPFFFLFEPDGPFERGEPFDPDGPFERGEPFELDRSFESDGARRRRQAAAPIPMPTATTPPMIHAEKRSQTLRPVLLVA